jgi:DNA-binding transcriptional LysR family regulator
MDIRRLDLNLLLLLDGLLASGNLSATARRLGISQPSASAGLAKLRHFFRDDLFVRTGRGLRPTPFAEGLEKPVRYVIDKITHEILLKPAFDPQESDRVFALTMPDLGEVIFLPPIITRLQAEAPRVGIKCMNIAYSDVRDALEEGVVDLAIGHFPDLLEPAVKSQDLYEDRFVGIVRGDHPRAHENLTLDAFLQLEHLAVEREGRQESFETGGADLDLKRQIRLQIPHFMSVPRLVAASDMISVVPLSLASRFAGVYGLRIVEPPMPLPKVPLKQFWHRRMDNDPALGWLRSLIAGQLVGLDPREAPSYSYEARTVQA